MIRKLSPLLLLFITALPIQAATRYVSKTGSNANACSTTDSAGTNKLTVAAGIGCMSSGDTLIIHAGTYNETINGNSINIPSGSNWSSPTLIKGFAGETITFTGTNDIFNLTNVANPDTRYVVFQDFIVDGVNQTSGTTGNIVVNGAKFIRFQNIESKNSWNMGFFFAGASSNTASGIEVLNCNSHNNGRDGAGYSLYAEAGGVLVSGNLFHDNTGGGLQMDDSHTNVRSDNNTITGNKIYNNANGLANFGIALDGSNNLIANNLLYNNQGVGMDLSYGPSGTGTKCYNNTIITRSGNNTGINLGGFATVTAFLVKNNIVRTFSNGNGTIATPSCSGCTIDHNLTASDPLFVNFASNDFHLTSNSPAKDTGADLSSTINTDLDALTRPQGGIFDIGAFEFPSPGGLSPPALEPFTGTGALSSWTQQIWNSSLATISRSSDQGKADALSTDCAAFENAHDYSPGQYAQMTIVTGLASGSHFAGLLVRASSTGSTANAYGVYTDGASGAGHTSFFKIVNHTVTQLGAISTTVASGNIIKLSIDVNHLLTFWKDSGSGFVSIATQQITSPEVTAGNPGIYVYEDTANNIRLEDWEGGNYAVSPFPTIYLKFSGGTDATSYNTASWTPVANQPFIVWVVNSRASSPTTPTISGNGLTWTQIRTRAASTGARRITAFSSPGHATPTAGALTVDFGGVTQTNCLVQIDGYPAHNPTGFIIQSADNDTASGTTLSVTLGAFANSANDTIGGVANSTNTGAMPGLGFTEINETSNSSPNASLQTEFKNMTDTSVDFTFGTGEATAIAIEIKALVQAGGGAMPRLMSLYQRNNN